MKKVHASLDRFKVKKQPEPSTTEVMKEALKHKPRSVKLLKVKFHKDKDGKADDVEGS